MSEINPIIPAEEYPLRWKQVQKLMAELNLDIILAYGDDRATFGPAHARWLADIMETNPDNSPVTVSMDEVFYME